MNTNALIEQYIPLANKLARQKKKTLPHKITFEELQSAAYMGLVDAASRFDESKGFSFSTFAYWRIIGEMQDYLRELGWGSNKGDLISSLDQETDEEILLKDTIQSKTESNSEEFLEDITKDLPPIAKEIFFHYYFENMSLKEIGKLYNVSESRISQLIGEFKKTIRDAA